jgi:quercetin dioxygenase-like cupin family protein
VVHSKYYEWLFDMVRFLGIVEARAAAVLQEVPVRCPKKTVVAAFVAGCVAAAWAVSGPLIARQDHSSRSRTAFTGRLPELDGRHLTATLVEVTYPAGGANAPHRHPCPVIGYVLEGAVRMQLKGQPERVFEAGETFVESPSDVHAVSANASADRPARFLAYFVCDHETPLTVAATEGRSGR